MDDDERDDTPDHADEPDEGGEIDEDPPEHDPDDPWSEWGEWEEPDRGRGLGALLAALVVGVVATLAAVLLWNQLASGDADQAPAARADVRPAPATGPATDDTDDTDDANDTDPTETVQGSRGATRLSRCVSAYDRLQPPLDAARASLDQWSVHVGAMNKLVVGEITLQQATDFWDETRVGAHRRIEDFDTAFDLLRREGVDCPDPGLLAAGNVALPSCARAVQAEVGTLHAAQVSIATWAEHVHHMDMLRLGQMTPEQATTAWLASWKQGVRELRAFAAASRTARRQDGCERTTAGE